MVAPKKAKTVEPTQNSMTYWHWLGIAVVACIVAIVQADIWVFLWLVPNLLFNAMRANAGKKTMFWKIFIASFIALLLLYFLTLPPVIPN